MSSYNPPTENLPTFNSTLFNQAEETLSQAEADKLYLSKTKNDTSTASLTTFNGEVQIKNNLSIGIRGVAQGIFNLYRRMRIWDVDNNQQTYGDYFCSGSDMYYTCKNDSATPSTTHQFYTRGAGVAVDNIQMTIANGTTTFNNQVDIKGPVFIGTAGVSTGVVTIYRSIKYTSGSTTTYGSLFGESDNMMYYVKNDTGTPDTSHRFFTRGAGSAVDNLQMIIANGTTTFSGAVNVSGNIQGSSLIQSNTTSASTNSIYTNLFTGSTLAIGTANSSSSFNGSLLVKNKIKLSELSNLDITGSITLSFPIAETNVIRIFGGSSATINLPNVTINDAGLLFNFFKFQAGKSVTFSATQGIYTLDDLGTSSTTNSTLLAVDKTMTTLMCGWYNNGTSDFLYWVEVSNFSTFDRALLPKLASANVFTNLGINSFAGSVSINNRLTFTPTSYSFPFGSNQSLGYYLKATGSAVTSGTYTSGNYVNLLTTSSIPIGVWRIEYSATNSVSAGGNITATDTMVSSLTGTTTTTPNTPVAFTGSQNKTHTTENYGAGDSHIVNGSFTYNQSTAGVLYLVFRRTFVSGTYSWIGEVAITRIA